MNQKMVKQALTELESSQKVKMLSHFLEASKFDNCQACKSHEDLSELLLDVLHDAFTAGFEAAVESTISSFNEKMVE